MARRKGKKRNKSDSPKIYVADLAAYNNGVLHGAWIDLSGKDAGDVYEEIDAIIQSSPVEGAEEFAIHDYEGFGSYKVDEYDRIEDLVALAEAIEEHGDAFSAFLSYHGSYYSGKLDDALSDFQDAFRGEYQSEEAYAEEFLDSTGEMSEVPEWAQPYFDMEKYARDMFMGDVYSIDTPGGIYVFSH